MQTGQRNHTDTSEILFLNLQKIFRCLSFGRSLQAKAPTLSVTQMRILSFFNERDVVYISEISRVLGMSLQSVNNLVHRLEVRGYVERSKNSSDKRLSDIAQDTARLAGDVFHIAQPEAVDLEETVVHPSTSASSRTVNFLPVTDWK